MPKEQISLKALRSSGDDLAFGLSLARERARATQPDGKAGGDDRWEGNHPRGTFVGF